MISTIEPEVLEDKLIGLGVVRAEKHLWYKGVIEYMWKGDVYDLEFLLDINGSRVSYKPDVCEELSQILTPLIANGITLLEKAHDKLEKDNPK